MYRAAEADVGQSFPSPPPVAKDWGKERKGIDSQGQRAALTRTRASRIEHEGQPPFRGGNPLVSPRLPTRPQADGPTRDVSTPGISLAQPKGSLVGSGSGDPAGVCNSIISDSLFLLITLLALRPVFRN
jgi:hypothetical protein